MFRLTLASAALAGVIAGVASVAAGERDQVKLVPASIKQIEAEIAKHKGKIVIVDLWADFCVPCKQEFPNLVRLHQEHAKDGLVCISVSIDDLDDQAKALKFLKSKGATFANFIVDEPKADAAQVHWDFSGVPVVLIYGRDGKLAKRFTNDDPCTQFTYKDVEKFLAPLLKQ
jgi:thiol-disulfide isomerase/thioredoxin